MTEAKRGAKLLRYSRRHTRLTDQQAAFIAHLIDELPPSDAVTWSTIVDLGRQHFQVAWSRQTLEKRAGIKEAYLRRVSSRTTENGAAGPRLKTNADGTDDDRRVVNLRAENDKLRAVLAEYDYRLVRYVANALAHGLTEAQLDAPLRPMVDPNIKSKRRR
ncbi:hypothetical protein V4889_00965 [Ralstonia solanacearum species complex bacterium KE101]|uniref:Hypothethical protein n=1 Tax=Ralstonia solanacearum TaxID=305 RepID=A0A0S4U6Q8_RALSL|nr:hypothetical protein HI812_14905 [Ralstonia solanacearum]QKL67634.1 hypothetical protein HI808_14910 [Ralstonia solanacearum]QKM43863.1 hypothetical protein HI792_14835 [Ralstonia solanacearum]QWF10976.1 hypothetical protein KME70_13435 [Ralstonia solanacearum]CUV17936.1 Hypothethical protein [Ralstonia solanacearum]